MVRGLAAGAEYVGEGEEDYEVEEEEEGAIGGGNTMQTDAIGCISQDLEQLKCIEENNTVNKDSKIDKEEKGGISEKSDLVLNETCKEINSANVEIKISNKGELGVEAEQFESSDLKAPPQERELEPKIRSKEELERENSGKSAVILSVKGELKRENFENNGVNLKSENLENSENKIQKDFGQSQSENSKIKATKEESEVESLKHDENKILKGEI